MPLAFRSACLRLVARVAAVPGVSLAAAGMPRAMASERSSGAGPGERGLSSASPGQGEGDPEAQARGRVMSFLALFQDFEEIGVPTNAAAVPAGHGGAARAAKGAGTFDLQRMQDLVHALGRPLDAYQVVHVAGTKGKGTTASFLASILRAAGLRTGLYTRCLFPGLGLGSSSQRRCVLLLVLTERSLPSLKGASSPHLLSLGERIRGASGRPLQWQRLESLVRGSQGPILSVHEQHARALTKFEVVTALAYKYFAEDGLDVAVVEVGLGGILDATNVIPAASLALAVITAVGKDHVAALGGSLASIARAKAGIMKQGKPVVIGPQFHGEALAELLAAASSAGATPVVTVTSQGLPALAAPPSAASGASDKATPPHALGSSTQAVPESAAWRSVAAGTASVRCGGPPFLDSRGQRVQEVELSWWGPLPGEPQNEGPPSTPEASTPSGAGGGAAPPTWSLSGVQLRMLGQHMAENAAVAASAALLLRSCEPLVAKGFSPSNDAIRRGLAATEVPGRFQVLSRGQAQQLGLEGAEAVVLDGAALCTTLEQAFGRRSPCKLIYVVAMANDKEHLATLSALLRTGPGLALKAVVLTQVKVAGSSARSMDAHELAAQCHHALQVVSAEESERGPAGIPSTTITQSLIEALQHARTALQDPKSSGTRVIVCFTGSLHLVGALLQDLNALDQTALF